MLVWRLSGVTLLPFHTYVLMVVTWVEYLILVLTDLYHI